VKPGYEQKTIPLVEKQGKPWKQSTGARTAEGKAKVSKNAVKTGKSLEVRKLIKYLNGLLREQRNLIGQ
ncbi:MAG: hypothetical protein ACOYK2_06490, partial [Polynucleobacter sp.]